MILPGEVICAPDSFKGTLSSGEAAAAMERGVRNAWPGVQVKCLPLADGGEGSLEVLHASAGGRLRTLTVRDPLGRPVDAAYLVLDENTAAIEMARASGLLLVASEGRDALAASTYGTGELIRDAINEGARTILVFLGGSATTDGGAGIAQALGYRLLDARGVEIPPGGGGLEALERIDSSMADARIEGTTVIAATDVVNPLCGDRGAARVYAPQKGATPEQVARLDRNLARLSRCIERDRGVVVANQSGAGAAGGLAAGLMGFLGARIESGADVVMDAVRLDEAIRNAWICLTGEGKIDSQTSQGKLLSRLARRCAAAKVPLMAFGGLVDNDVTIPGISATLCTLRKPGGIPSPDEAARWLQETVANAIGLLRVGWESRA